MSIIDYTIIITSRWFCCYDAWDNGHVTSAGIWEWCRPSTVS